MQQTIIPHCTACRRPCCKLTDVVLELSWQQLKTLYTIDMPQKQFNESLQSKTGPTYIRAQASQYYAFGKSCPAYTSAGQCAVYGTDTKPQTCTDYPVYRDGNVITADLRCEAVQLPQLFTQLKLAAPELIPVSKPDRRFPQLINIELKRAESV